MLAAPNACKYTEQGTIVDDMMKQIAKAERRMQALTELEITLSASDKEALLKDYKAKAAEEGADPASFSLSDVPDKLKVGGA